MQRTRILTIAAVMIVLFMGVTCPYYDGHIAEDEFRNLRWNLEFAAKRPNMQMAYTFLKRGYPKKVQAFWEALDSEREATLSSDILKG